MPLAEQRTVDVLLIEDDPADVRLFRESLNELTEWCTLSVAKTGSEALDRLFRRGQYAGEKTPDLILLDLNLPILTGHEVLTVLKAMPPLNEIPVIVLTTSQNPADIRKAYDLGASCYVIKPRDLDAFLGMCKSIYDFWFRRVTFPRPVFPSKSLASGN
jgi:chemotaxis family two-component system response regulator Rcp1